VSNPDPVAGLEDCRRAIRLGRLLRQDDAVLINDLVGLACVNLGARGAYRIAQRTGDRDLALLASVVIGEAAPQRLYASERVTVADLSPFVRRDTAGRYSPVPDSRLDDLVKMITTAPERRFRAEPLISAGGPSARHTAGSSKRIAGRARRGRRRSGSHPRLARPLQSRRRAVRAAPEEMIKKFQ
jgi:hypothetical protein